MAVINDYVTHNASSVAVNADTAARFSGGRVRAIPFSFEVAAADSDGSVYRIGQISPLCIMKSIKLLSDAIAAANDYDIGVYKPLAIGGAVIKKDCFLDGADINAGKATFTEMFVPAIDAVGKSAFIVAGLSAADIGKYGVFDLAITANTVGTAAGTISGIIEVIDVESL